MRLFKYILPFAFGLCAMSPVPGSGSAFAAAAATSAAPAGGNCPVQGMDNVAKAINNAANCRAAVGMLKACAFGSSADNALASAAIAKCEARFGRRITKQRFRAYRDAQRRCDAKYAKMEGTMYQSAAAICRADAALAYSRATRRLTR
ncbi:hypothetical protein PY365_25845 [Roseiarcaceae bacterium H3SJ34-1]|uniref:hypothetical protein n=1 Tax=Terripilifer ovatus TaxID=3032367 RepID=UPI003AB934FA|nr:hypothetical protein [Roseiarcaceae bacterium H3SJ34-1]